MKKLLFLFLIFIIGCKNEPKDLLVIRKNEKLSGFNLKYELVLKSDGQFYDESGIGNLNNDNNYKKVSHYRIKNDTIYLEQPILRSKKAIVKNGYLDFIESYPPNKIKVSENKLVKDLNSNNCNSDDFTYFTSYGYMKKFTFTDFGFKGKDANLTCDEEQQARNLFQKAIDENREKFGNHSKQSDYLKCCAVLQTDQNEKIVYLRGYANNFDEFYKETLVEVKAAEKASVVYLTLNLTQNYYFKLNTDL